MENEVQVQIHTTASKPAMTLGFLGPVPLMLSRLSTVISHTRSTTQTSSAPLAINNNRSRVFFCDDERLRKSLEEGPQMVRITYNNRDKQGIVTMIDSTHYILNYTTTVMGRSSDTVGSFSLKSSSAEKWIEESRGISLTPQNDLKLVMTPPVNSSPVQKSDQEDTSNDPFDYFLDKYFQNLYMLTTPLTFFTKSVFTRLKALCGNDLKVYESILSQFLVKIDQFDTRHLISNNGLLNSPPLFEKEEIYRKDFIGKSLNLLDFDVHASDFQETNRSLVTFLSNFKVRETHLQILILLELIHVTEKDDAKLFKKKKAKKTKKKLVGRKKLATVISGGSIPLEDSNDDTQPKVLTYNQLLDAYVGKLTINDLLNGLSSSENYAPKFVNYIVVPFFDKKCPNSVKHIIKMIKGPSFKPAPTKSEKKRSSSTDAPGAIKRPALERTSSTGMKLDGIAELKANLARSNSDLQSLKRTSSFNANTMTRRQVDLSLPTIPAVEAKPLKKTSSQIFNRVGKKITTSSLKLSASVSQVEATPIKKNKTVDVMETPRDDNNITKHTQTINSVESGRAPGGSIHSSSPVTHRTPVQPSLQSPIAIRSTVKKPGEPIDFTERALMGSPLPAKNVKRRLFAPPPNPKH